MYKQFFEDAGQVYRKLSDEYSKYIFCNRLMYNISDDYRYINDITNQIIDKELAENNKEYIETFAVNYKRQSPDKPVIVYGAGIYGKRIAKRLMFYGLRITCFWDRNADNYGGTHTIRGVEIPIVIPLSGYTGTDTIVIAVYGFEEEIKEYLLRREVTKDDIFVLSLHANLLSKRANMYFEPEIIEFVEDEVFVDGGCYDLFTSIDLQQRCSTVKRIYAFECDDFNLKRIYSVLNNKKNIQIIEKGLWNKNTILSFYSSGNTSSRIMKVSDSSLIDPVLTEIKVCTIDETISEKVTFIKLDIEGAELEALKGASRTIKMYKPKLAISVYHKLADIVDIPQYITTLRDDYKIYLRHYTTSEDDTVLYAI